MTSLLYFELACAGPLWAGNVSNLLLHQPPLADELPLPGKELILYVSLRGSRDTNRRMRAVLVRDGRAINLEAAKSYLDENDRATYEFSVLSPLAEVAYQFMFYHENGEIEASKRYAVRRPCIPNLEVPDAEKINDPETNPAKRLTLMIQQAKHLEQELVTYDKAINLLREIKQHLPE